MNAHLTAAWYTDGTFWTITSVIVAVVLGVITVWAQFASANRARKHGAEQHGVVTAIAEVLGVRDHSATNSVENHIGPNLAGDWFAGWQSFKDGHEVFRYQPVSLDHIAADTIQIAAIERGADIEDGGFLWTGAFRLWDNAILLGWYAATDSSVRSKGTLYFTLHPHGQSMTGRWVGLSHDGLIISGWATMGRTRERASTEMRSLAGGASST